MKKPFGLLLILITIPMISFGSQDGERKKKQEANGVLASDWRDFEKEADPKKILALVETYSELRAQQTWRSHSVIERIVDVSDAQNVASNIKKLVKLGVPVDQINVLNFTALQWISKWGAIDRATTNTAIETLLEEGASISQKDIHGQDVLHLSLDSESSYNAARILSGHKSVRHIVNKPIQKSLDATTTHLAIALASTMLSIKDRAVVIKNFLKADTVVDESSVIALAEHHGVSTSDLRSCSPMFSLGTLDLLQKAKHGPLAFEIRLPNIRHCLCEEILPRCGLDILRRAQDALADKPVRIILFCLEAEIKKYHRATQEALTEGSLLLGDLINIVCGYVS